MKKRVQIWLLSFPLLLLVSLGGLISCTQTPEGTEVAEAGPRVWIDFPRDGAVIPVGASVTVVSHAYAEDGVAEVLISVNGTAYRRDPPSAGEDTLVEVRQEWIPAEPGLYTLEVRAYNAAGEVGSADAITVRVPGGESEGPTEEPAEEPTVIVTPTLTPTPTSRPTSTPTSTPTSSPTDTPEPTATFTPVPPVQVDFWVDDDSLIAGECTTLHWDVEHATAVYLDGEGVPGHATREVCPTDTTTYNLHVEAPSGNVDRSVTVTVSVPPDTTPPPVPTPTVPEDGLVLSCRSTQVLAWLPVSDPSSPVTYYVKLERKVTATEWEAVRDYGPLSGKQVEVEVDCGVVYRWAVRARDGAGNLSDWSEWSTFSINLG